jgi:hypothetical protein
MNRFAKRTVLLRVCVGILGLMPGSLTAAHRDEDDVLQANQALEKAFQKADKAEVERFLDVEFTWVDPEGIIHSKSEVLAELLQPVAVSGGETQVTERVYGQVAVVQEHNGQAHTIRVWVKRSAGWKILHAGEIIQPAKPEVGGPGIETPCINPCTILPFKPKSAAEQAVLKSWQEMETGAYNHLGAEWGAHAADEFQVISSWSNKPLTKMDRVDDFDRLGKKGVHTNPVAPVVWAHMWDFGNTIFMLSEHIRYGNKPDIASRVWVNRDGRWLLAVSYHTSIKNSPALMFQTTAPE